MRGFVKGVILVLSMFSTVSADNYTPVSYYLSFDNLNFLPEDWIEQSGFKNVKERKWELVQGRFGSGLYLGAVPLEYDDDNMSGLDLDIVTAIIFNVGLLQMKGRGYDEPFIWGAGRLHPGCGAIAFWAKGSSNPENPAARTILFEQTTTTWGRKERQLIEVELLRDGTITAYVEDARYVQHSIKTKKVWNDKDWNHIVFMWDRSSGLSLWVNGENAASSMGKDAWWENQRTGLFHLPMTETIYDEFYIFTRTLTDNEIRDLYRENKPPQAQSIHSEISSQDVGRVKNAFTSETTKLPVIIPSTGKALVFEEITPERIHDEGITGWWIADGRYELAWPHEYSVFTIIPGDVDFHAEKADILPPRGTEINYLTFEGNLDGVKVLKGDREGNFDTSPVITVPQKDGFFYGTMVNGLGDAELRIPLTKSYGTPPGFESDGNVLKLPLSGNVRLHEVGLFHVAEDDLPQKPGDEILHINTKPLELDDRRYSVALNALFAEQDRKVAGLYKTSDISTSSTVKIEPMGRLHFISEPTVGKFAFHEIIIDMWITSPTNGNVIQFRLHDAAVPSHTWTHAEVKLDGFTGKLSRLRLALEFDPMFLVDGDRVWLELLSTDGLTLVVGDTNFPSTISLRPEIDWAKAEEKFSLKTMLPNILTYGRSFEYIPWEWDKHLPNVDEPTNFGGMFDMAYPWQAVLKVNPGDRIAHIYKAYGTSEYPQGRWPSDMSHIPDKKFDAPENAPAWAVYFREFQTFRGRIVTWWRYHQRSDGQAGGGWNDDTLIFSRSLGDMQLDSNPDALALYNNVFNGFEATNYFKDGYCRIYPIDRLHNGDFVRERYKSLIYNLGDPRSATWAMEEAWHWNKRDKTPINYGDGKGFLFGKDVLEWYWGKQRIKEPYRLVNEDTLVENLRKAAIVNNDITLWRFTEAWVHTDDQSQYGADNLMNILLGGWGSSPGRNNPEYASKNINITVGVGWINGGGPQLGRLVEYSGNDGLKVRMYSFDSFDRDVTARLFRLDPGSYNVSLRSDNNGDGTYETVLTEQKQHITRFDRLPLNVPPNVPVYLEVTQLQADPDPGDLPDLATSLYYVKKQGNSLTVTVHNIGSAPSGSFTVSVLGVSGKELKTVKVESLPSAVDFVPKTVVVTIPDLPDQPKYQIMIDRENKVREIFEENNSVELVTGSM